ncbi:MAG: glycosyltransferase family 2 protein [Ignavibacteriaceae bacterium]
MNQKITVLITTFNSEKNIERALKSITWCDEIIVVDSHSTDNTISIVNNYNAKIFYRVYEGSSRQLEYGVSLSENENILILDSDEEVTEELKNDIKKILEAGSFNKGGYKVQRRTFFIDKWIKYGGWGNDFQYRLINKTYTVFLHNHDAHWSIKSDYPLEFINSFINHYTYDNIYDYIGRMNIYSSLDVKTKFQGKPALIIKKRNFILNPLAEFVKMFFFAKGYKDGVQGFILAAFSTIHKFTAYLKMWEYQYLKNNNLELPPVTYSELKKNKKN